MKKIFLIVGTLFFMSSCNIYTTYKRPEVKVDSTYRDSAVSEDTTSLASLSWRELFTDSKLQILIEQGLVSNTDLRIAQLKVTESEAALQAARLAYAPSVSVTPQGTLGRLGDYTSKTYDLSLSASWEVDIFGKIRNAKESSKAALEQTLAYKQAVQTQLIATIANSYYTLLMLDGQLEITKRTAENWEKNVSTMRALKLAGRTTEAAVAQSEANYIAVKSSILSFEQQINEVENSLCTLLALSAQKIERGELSTQKFPAELSIGVPLQLLSNRPDVRQAEYVLTKAFYETNKARSAFYPSLSLSGSAGWTNSGGGVVLNPGGLMLSVLGSLAQPIFNKGLNKANLKITKAQQEEAVLSFQQAILSAGAEVNDALTQWQTSRRQIEFDVEKIAALESALNSTKLLMMHGNITYLEVLVAQQSLLQSELNLLSNKFNEIQGVISLYHSLGGGC